MTVRIVTDSVSDLPSEVAKELWITVIPLIVRFGTEVYRDGIDLTAEQFYDRLKYSQTLPLQNDPCNWHPYRSWSPVGSCVGG